MTDIIGIGLQHFATRVEARKFERAAAKGLAEDARHRKSVLQTEFDRATEALHTLTYCKVDGSAIAEALAILIDAVSDADHACNLDIDAAGEHFDSLDLTEARAMLDGLRRPHSKVLA